jgi:hypothetical protein
MKGNSMASLERIISVNVNADKYLLQRQIKLQLKFDETNNFIKIVEKYKNFLRKIHGII